MEYYKNYISPFFTFLRIIFGLIFIFSAIIKIIDIDLFRDALISFNIINNSLIQITVYSIPLLEFILGLALLLNFKTSIASQLITFMVALFTAVVVAKIFEGAEISCGCFGELTSDKIDSFTVIRNVILMLWGISLTVYYENRSIQKEKRKQTKNKLKNEVTKTRLFDIIKSTLLVTIFFFLGVQTVIFAIQNKQLKIRLSLLLTDKDVVKEGDTLSTFSVIDIEQKINVIDYPAKKKTLVYILSTKCTPCTNNLVNWKKLTSILDNEKVRIIGVALNSIDEIKIYNSEHKLNFPVYIPENEQFKIDYKGFITPQTLLIDENAIVLKSIQGILQEITLSEIIDAI